MNAGANTVARGFSGFSRVREFSEVMLMTHVAFECERGDDVLALLARLCDDFYSLDEEETSGDSDNGPRIPSMKELELGSAAITHTKLGSLRAEFRILCAIVGREAAASDRIDNTNDVGEGSKEEWRVLLAQAYLSRIAGELAELLATVLGLVDTMLQRCFPVGRGSSDTTPQRVFLLKFRADYLRYRSELLRDCLENGAVLGESPIATLLLEEAKTEAGAAYSAAQALARATLPTTAALRLGLALNASVFHVEIMDDRENGIAVAKNAFDDALTQLDSLPEDDYRNTTLIMQLLRDNVSLWDQECGEA
jgi:14-3-3 protein epsilon